MLPPRGELLNLERLEQRGRQLALEMATSATRSRASVRAHGRRLDENARVLRRAYLTFSEDVRREAIPPAAEWLLDNYHLVEAEIVGIRRDLPAAYHLQLPIVAGDREVVPFAGRARIYALALDVVEHSDARIDAYRLERFLALFQSVAPLSLGELWAWPSVVKTALIEHLRRICDVLLASRADHVAAARYMEPLESGGDADALPELPQVFSPAFLVELLARLREHGPRVAAFRSRLEARFAAAGQNTEDAVRADQQTHAAVQVSIGNTITSLRLCATLNWSAFIERVSLVEQVLQGDPSGAYSRMTFESRDRYRAAVEEIAGRSGDEQVAVARQAVDAARETLGRSAAASPGGDARASHVGYHLIGRGRAGFEKLVRHAPKAGAALRRLVFRNATTAYLGAITLLTLLGVAAAFAAADAAGAGKATVVWTCLLALMPASELAVGLVQRLVAALAAPRRLPRFSFDGGVPDTARTLVVVPTILDSVAAAVALFEHLEVQALGNSDANIHFAVLADFSDSTRPRDPEDAAIVGAARDAVRELNARHNGNGGERFWFFHRERRFSESEGIWMGWERKRGKIEEFARLLRGATDTSYEHDARLFETLPHFRYLITLDRDTRLPREAARTLIGIADHPLNRPAFEAGVGRVVEGYGILQPRVSVTFESAAGSIFARLYAGHTGVDPYTSAVSDAYQDLFGEGIFTGKGLIEIDAFNAALEGRVPENALLSHDLFEGLYARTALVSDVELVDDYPASVLAHARRQHRWVRGDWQILRWLSPFVPVRGGVERNTLPAISRFKIFDNLRRSLVPPCYVAFLAGAWTFFPGAPWMWTAALLAVLAFPAFFKIPGVLRPRRGERATVWARYLVEEIGTALAQWAITLTFLAYQAAAMLHAIGLTLVRVLVTRRRMLEWETAAASQARTRHLVGLAGLRAFAVEMVASPAIALALVPFVLAAGHGAPAAAAPILLLWLVAPLVAYLLSQRAVAPQPRALTSDERTRWRMIARKTWRYFDELVGEADHFLPPDNLQEEPGRMVARRTSPTDIAMGLLATLAAHDLGYLDTASLEERLRRTLTTLGSMEHFRGHLLNWYETSSLAPLLPRYVSTVDSGNLAGVLMALAQGLLEIAERPDPNDRLAGGVEDAEELLQVARAHAARNRRTFDPEVEYWTRMLAQSQDLVERRAQLPTDRPALVALAERCEAMARDMDFGFLYDDGRKLFSIGYQLADHGASGRLDTSYYDLLASEARLASFIAIANEQVPQSHWFQLGRPVTSVDGVPVLLSWSATMFEYLMPMLLMKTYPGTLLDRATRMAVKHQERYGVARGVPWGMSESGFAVTDRLGQYQYKAFGVPGLGMKRGLADELVIAPYATALAAQVDAPAALANFERLARLGGEGPYGFYEALDFTPRKTELEAAADGAHTGGNRPEAVVVRAYLAHHQGMTIGAIANVLDACSMTRRFHADPRVQATELLLQERVPRGLATQNPRPAEETRVAVAAPSLSLATLPLAPHRSPARALPLERRLYRDRHQRRRRRLSVPGDRGDAAARGSDARHARAVDVHLPRDVRDGSVWSPAFHPADREPEEYLVTFLPQKATFRRLRRRHRVACSRLRSRPRTTSRCAA